MALVDKDTLTVGQSVAFKCNHPTDANLYEGMIDGIVNYAVARTLEDLVPYYSEVAKNIPTMLPIDKLSYIILSITKDGVTTQVARAKEWITDSTLKVIEQDVRFDIRIYGSPVNEVQTILDLLQTHGYECALVE